MKHLIENSATNNSLLMIFEFQLREDSPHPCLISLRINKRNIVPWTTKIGVTSCPKLSSKVIVKGR